MTIIDTFANHVYMICCDCCGQKIEKYLNPRQRNNEFHFCSNACVGKSSILKKKRRMTCQERYHVDHISQTQSYKEKYKATCIQRYGVDHVMKSAEIQERRRKTCKKNHGVDWPLQSKMMHEKGKATSITKYGTLYPNQSELVKDKIKSSIYERFGYECALQSPEIQEKIKQTNIERYGSAYPMQSNIIKAKFNHADLTKKRFETMKQNGTYRKSATEDHCYNLLCEKFGSDDVQRQAHINTWNIDFYIKSIDVYVQLDGVYWHGLDRPIEQIYECKSSHDTGIIATYENDQKQNSWFRANNYRLVRITDIEFNSDPNILFERLN